MAAAILFVYCHPSPSMQWASGSGYLQVALCSLGAPLHNAVYAFLCDVCLFSLTRAQPVLTDSAPLLLGTCSDSLFLMRLQKIQGKEGALHACLGPKVGTSAPGWSEN